MPKVMEIIEKETKGKSYHTYPYYTGRIAEILGCTDEEVAPFVHLSILAINNYMIFAERALFDPQIEAVKKELSRLAERKGRNNR